MGFFNVRFCYTDLSFGFIGCPLTAIPSKPKIKYCKKVNHTTDNASGTNESTNRTDIYHGIYKNLDENENKLKAFIRRYASAEIDDNGKTTLRELATLRHGQNLHENFIRYFGMEEENNFRCFMFIFF